LEHRIALSKKMWRFGLTRHDLALKRAYPLLVIEINRDPAEAEAALTRDLRPCQSEE
jgi:hypothetical protein